MSPNSLNGWNCIEHNTLTPSSPIPFHPLPPTDSTLNAWIIDCIRVDSPSDVHMLRTQAHHPFRCTACGCLAASILRGNALRRSIPSCQKQHNQSSQKRKHRTTHIDIVYRRIHHLMCHFLSISRLPRRHLWLWSRSAFMCDRNSLEFRLKSMGLKVSSVLTLHIRIQFKRRSEITAER